jgi:spore coat polysaccharide biosynthesis predicted glycosyltransferase SpsG
MRCLALAAGLRDLGHDCHLLVADSIAAIDRRVTAEGATLSHIAASAEDAAAEATGRYAAAIDASAIIVDGYHFGAQWRENLRRLGRPVLSFYDFAPQEALGADLVLCPALDARPPTVRAAAGGARWLCGPSYLLLRRDLRRALSQPPLPWPQRRSILVTFGGSDPAALTRPVVLGLADPPLAGARLEVVIGGGVAGRDALAKELSRLCPALGVHVDAPNLGMLMREAGLAVSAAGTTIGELAAFGVPSLIVAVADNQLPGARQAAARGWCRMLDARTAAPVTAIVDLARLLWDDDEGRQALAQRASRMTDGEGVARVCKTLIELASGQH